jgi:hypothetical protein
VKEHLRDDEICDSDSTAADESASTGSEARWDDVEDVQDSNSDGFDGMWGPACISKGVLTWSEGEEVVISVLNERRFSMNYVGKSFVADLDNDGRLHWDDGDVWTRTDTKPNVAVYPPWRRGTSCAYLLLPALPKKSEAAMESLQDRDERSQHNLKVKAPWRRSTSKSELVDDHHKSQRCRLQIMQKSSEPAVALASPQATQLGCDAKALATRTQVPTKLQKDEVTAVFSKTRQTNLPPWLRATSRRSLAEQAEMSPAKPRVVSGSQEREEADVPTRRATSFAEVLSRPAPLVRLLQEPNTLRQKSQNITQHESLRTITPGQQEQVRSLNLASEAASIPNASAEKSRQSRGKSVIVSAPTSSKQYEGFVKYFRGAFGRIESAEAMKQYPDVDVFVHINDCNFRPRQWDRVSFQLAEDHNGNPKAVRVSAWKEPSHIDARDWFALDREGKKKLLARLDA